MQSARYGSDVSCFVSCRAHSHPLLTQVDRAAQNALVQSSLDELMPGWQALSKFRCSLCTCTSGRICDGWNKQKQETRGSNCVCGLLCPRTDECRDGSVRRCASGSSGACGGYIHTACNNQLQRLYSLPAHSIPEGRPGWICSMCTICSNPRSSAAIDGPVEPQRVSRPNEV